jgi:hypothetical protein
MSCEHESTKDPLNGKWINTKDYNKYIEFTDDNNAIIDGVNFNYQLNQDSIYFQFGGPSYYGYENVLFIYCPNSADHGY